jgi:hypothetical protein
MRDIVAISAAKGLVDRQLRQLKFGNTHQRAMLVGLRDALDWVLEVGDKHVLQQLLDGRAILPNSETIAEAAARQRSEEGQKSRKGCAAILSPWSGVADD